MNTGIGDRAYFEEHYSPRVWRQYASILGQLVTFGTPGPMLDAGAGPGFLVECATQWGLDCQGIDGSHAAVELGLARAPGIKLQQHFLSDPLPFPDDSFQTIVLNQVIEHLEPPVVTAALREFYRVLRPGGMVFITSPCRYNIPEFKADPTHINMMTPTELRQHVEAAGFRDVAPMDGGRALLGEHLPGRVLGRVAFRLTPWDRLSATANCRAFKP